MAAAQLGGVVQLVVLADWDASQALGGSDPPVSFPDGLQLYRITGGGVAPELIAEAPEGNLDNPLEVVEIVRAVFSALPSERRGLVLWDHGGSWNGGFGGDTQNGTVAGSPMSAAQVADAIRSGIAAAGISEPKPFDFIAFDTCLMAGAEVAFPFVDLTDTYIAAAEIDYGPGWDYEATFTHFAANPAAPMSQLAAAEVTHWDAHHASNSINDALLRSHAALDLTKLSSFASATAGLTAALEASSSFDLTELARSTFLSVSPYASQFDSGSMAPGLRDAGQLLASLGQAQSDSAVAQAAQSALQALEQMVLASSQGSLRAGAQIGVHLEQTLGAQLTAEHLQAYRGLASHWVSASGWDRVLELTSTMADATPPAFDHSVTNAEASSSALPVLQFTTADGTAAKGAVYVAAQSAPDTILQLGLLGSGLIQPNAVNEFTWDGTAVGFADGQLGMVDLWLDVPSGAQPLYSISGLLGDGTASEPLWASLVFGTDPAASLFVVEVGNQPLTLSTAEAAVALPGATFTPVYFAYTEGAEPSLVPGTPMPVTAAGFELFSWYVSPGDYVLMTSVTDIWGNTGTEADALTLSEALGQ